MTDDSAPNPSSGITRRRLLTLLGGALAAAAAGSNTALGSTTTTQPTSEEVDNVVAALTLLTEALTQQTGEKLAELVPLEGVLLYRYELLAIPPEKSADLLPAETEYEVKTYSEGYETSDLWTAVIQHLAADLVGKETQVSTKELILGPTTLIPDEALPPEFEALFPIYLFWPGSAGWDWRSWTLAYSDAEYQKLRAIALLTIEM